MYNKRDIHVIFLGAGPTALAGIRECGEFGCKIYAIGNNKYETGLFSKWTTPLAVLDPQKDSKKLLEKLKDFSKDIKDVILIPTGDEYIEFLSKYKEKLLEYGYLFSLAKSDTSELFLNKENFAILTNKTNTPTPKTWVKSLDIPIKEWAEDLLYPCIIKPVYYHKWAKIYGLKKGFIVHNKQELLEKFLEVSQKVSDIIVQEVIEGDDDQIVIFTGDFRKNGEVLQQFTGQKIRQYPVGFGTTTSAISKDIPKIKQISINILQHVNFEGVCDVEYKYDRRDNQYKIIEINPRIGRWYGLVTASKKYPLYSSILSLLGDEKVKEKKQDYGIQWLFPIRDFPAILKRKDLKAMKEYIKFGKKWCVYDSKDMKPFFIYFMEMASKLYNHKVKSK